MGHHQVKNLVVCDIDGCCIESSERLPFFRSGDMDGYHANHALDKPLAQGVEVYRLFLSSPKFRVLFVTARCETAKDYTLMQLQEFVDPTITSEQLIMRPKEYPIGSPPDHELKPQLLIDNGYSLDEIFLVFDDMAKTISEWRALGVVAYQTAVGKN